MAKEDSVDLKGAVKRLAGKQHDEEMDQALLDLTTTRDNLEAQQQECTTLKKGLGELNAACASTQGKIDSIPAEIIDIVSINTQIRNKENQVTSLKLKIGENEDLLKMKQGVYQKIVAFLKDFDLDKYQALQRKLTENRDELKSQETTLDKLLDAHNDVLKKEEFILSYN